MFDLLLACTAVAVACFTLLLLHWQPASDAQLPLRAVLGCLAFFAAGPIIFQVMPAHIQLYVSLLPLAFFLYLPAFWFYHHLLIAQSPRRWRSGLLWHFLTLPFAMLLGAAIHALSPQDFEQIFFSSDGVSSGHLIAFSLAFFVALVAWFVLSAVYGARIIGRTVALRGSLKDLYSNQSNKELIWTVVVAALNLLIWGYGLAALIFEDRFKTYGLSETGVFFLLAAMVWTVCLNGVKQRPVYEEVRESASTVDPAGGKAAYQRSTLSDSDLDRIAAKLADGIAQKKLHLSPDLNLPNLSTSLGERPQYISQTLSQRLHTTFFDFINQARIEEAKRMLISTDLSVLDIAMACGFNSRSSFYKAFKQIAHQTPTQYRQSQH